MATPISAASAYANIAKLASSSPLSGGEESGTSFSSVLKQAMGAVTEAGQKAAKLLDALALPRR